MEQGRSTAAPLAPVLSTAQAASPEDVPAELEPVGSVPAILLPVKLTTDGVLQLFTGRIFGQLLLGVFMLALGGVILPGNHSCVLMTIILSVFCSAVVCPAITQYMMLSMKLCIVLNCRVWCLHVQRSSFVHAVCCLLVYDVCVHSMFTHGLSDESWVCPLQCVLLSQLRSWCCRVVSVVGV